MPKSDSSSSPSRPEYCGELKKRSSREREYERAAGKLEHMRTAESARLRRSSGPFRAESRRSAKAFSVTHVQVVADGHACRRCKKLAERLAGVAESTHPRLPGPPARLHSVQERRVHSSCPPFSKVLYLVQTLERSAPDEARRLFANSPHENLLVDHSGVGVQRKHRSSLLSSASRTRRACRPRAKATRARSEA